MIDRGLSACDHAGVFALADHQVTSGASLITQHPRHRTDQRRRFGAGRVRWHLFAIACAQMVNTQLLELLMWACGADLTGTAPVL
ncbi:hypothetical protein C6369_000230 [Rhodococcus rhodochrous]|nr:hypothetical protein C6369_000230 [Rhodococcus rhodochrous]